MTFSELIKFVVWVVILILIATYNVIYPEHRPPAFWFLAGILGGKLIGIVSDKLIGIVSDKLIDNDNQERR